MANMNPNQMLQNSLGSLKEIKSMYNMVMNANNPNVIINHMMNSNPQMKNICDVINNDYKGNGKAAFYDRAHELGMTDEQIDKYVEELKKAI